MADRKPLCMILRNILYRKRGTAYYNHPSPKFPGNKFLCSNTAANRHMTRGSSDQSELFQNSPFPCSMCFDMIGREALIQSTFNKWKPASPLSLPLLASNRRLPPVCAAPAPALRPPFLLQTRLSTFNVHQTSTLTTLMYRSPHAILIPLHYFLLVQPPPPPRPHRALSSSTSFRRHDHPASMLPPLGTSSHQPPC